MSTNGHPGSIEPRSRITILPRTGLGRWALGLGAAFFPLVLAGSVVPRGAALGLACGLAGGAASLTAIVRDGERSVAVFAALVPLAVAAAFLLAEVISGNA
jgi:hypothetical protein